ncbi:hypothetical protein ACSDR0_49550, partial [Streptosporangium sp. G11]
MVGVLDGKALAVGEIVLHDKEIFDYEAKYQVGGALEVFPAEISSSLEADLKTLAARAHESLKLGSYSRVDFRVDDHGQIWCLEVNTLPGADRHYCSLLQAIIGNGVAVGRQRASRRSKGRCPHDGTATTQSPRYPKALCEECMNRATWSCPGSVDTSGLSATRQHSCLREWA